MSVQILLQVLGVLLMFIAGIGGLLGIASTRVHLGWLGLALYLAVALLGN